ncbi:MAG: hypothetical protein HOK69_12290 [Gammaproteobacteria bacterium]|nr:hypothetical protein [Gammaproteobacteria bacterium]
MNLAEDDIEYIKSHMPEWLAAQSLASPPAVYEIELRERTIRVEEELKHQRELMKQGFEQMEKRFEQVDKRFEQVDKHFESMQKQMDKRFDSMQQHIEQIAKRHDRMQWLIFLTIVTYFFKEKLAPLLGG